MVSKTTDSDIFWQYHTGFLGSCYDINCITSANIEANMPNIDSNIGDINTKNQ